MTASPLALAQENFWAFGPNFFAHTILGAPVRSPGPMVGYMTLTVPPRAFATSIAKRIAETGVRGQGFLTVIRQRNALGRIVYR